MSYNESASFGEDIKLIYTELGYELIEAPKVEPRDRASFITKRIDELRQV